MEGANAEQRFLNKEGWQRNGDRQISGGYRTEESKMDERGQVK